MPDPIFDQYREQLRAGHVAVLQGRLELALEHYGRAAVLADTRALPHTSMGQVLIRLGRLDEALGAFSRALGRAHHDEGALTGRAEALAAARRPVEAAEILDRLADVQAASDREPEALATLQRALALGVTRRRQRRATELATHLGVAIPRPPAAATPPAESLERTAADALDDDLVTPIHATPAPAPLGSADLLAASDPEAFLDDAELARDGGRDQEALALLVLASDAYARAGAREAALEACQRALGIRADAPAVHIALVRLYLARGWRERAIEKLVLLDRLLALGPASGARRQVAALAAQQAAGDPRLLALASPAGTPPPSTEVAPAPA